MEGLVGTVLDNTYRIEALLGQGGMGAVWLVAQTRAFDRLAVLKEVVEYYDPTDPAERQKALLRFEAEARAAADALRVELSTSVSGRSSPETALR